MPELLSLVIQTARAAVSRRNDLILENLLLRHQLRVALRPKRWLSPRRQDRILWVLVRQLRPDWRRYLLYVRPEAVIRWHRSVKKAGACRPREGGQKSLDKFERQVAMLRRCPNSFF